MHFLLANEAVKNLVDASTEASTVVSVGPDTVTLLLTVFVLAVFIGVEVITKIPPTLHTPLMSGSNAISGIALVGAVIAAGSGDALLPRVLGCVAVTLATINAVGGFMVTHRMLGMFRRKD